MPNPVYIDFAVRGVKDVDRAFKSVFDSIIGAEGKFSTRVGQFAQKREQITRREVSAREREYQKLVKHTERWERDEVRSAERAAKAKEKAADKAAAAEEKASKRAADAAEKAEQRKSAARERSAEAQLRRLQREVAAEERGEQRKAIARAKHDDRAASKASSQREGALRAMGAGTVANMQKLGGVGMGIARGVLNVGGGFSLEDSVKQEVAQRGQAANLVATMSKTAEGNRGLTSGSILAQAKANAIKSGLSTGDVLEAAGKFKDLAGGDVGRAMSIMPELTKMANAFGSDLGELGENAGNIVAANSNISDKDLIALLRVQAKQGQEGAVEIKDMAKYGARLTAGASLFGGDYSGNVAMMGAFTQMAREKGGAASPAEAALAAQQFGGDVRKKADAIEAMGIKVRDGKGKLRDGREIVKDMVGKSGGDVTKLTQFGLGERSLKVLTGAANLYSNAGGGDKGMAAINDYFAKMTSGVDDATVNAADAGRRQEADRQLEAAMTKLRSEVGEKLVPELIKLIPAIAKVTPHLAKLLDKLVAIVDWAANNPMAAAFAGLGASAALSVGKEMAAAGIGKLIASMLSGSGGGAGGSAGQLAGGLGGNALARTSMAAVAAGTGIASVITGSGEGYADGAMATDDIAAKVDAYARGDKTRGISPEHAQQLVAQAKGRLDNTSALTQASNIMAAPFSDTAAKDYKQYKADQALVDHEGLSKAIAKALEAGAAMAAPNLAAHPDTPNRNVSLAQRGGAQ